MAKGFNNLKSAHSANLLLTLCSVKLGTKLFVKLLKVNHLKHFKDCLGSHTCAEHISVLFIIFSVFFFR